MTPYTLEGSYDITLTDYCNLNCKGCCALDWLEEGKIVVSQGFFADEEFNKEMAAAMTTQ